MGAAKRYRPRVKRPACQQVETKQQAFCPFLSCPLKKKNEHHAAELLRGAADDGSGDSWPEQVKVLKP